MIKLIVIASTLIAVYGVLWYFSTSYLYQNLAMKGWTFTKVL